MEGLVQRHAGEAVRRAGRWMRREPDLERSVHDAGRRGRVAGVGGTGQHGQGEQAGGQGGQGGHVIIGWSGRRAARTALKQRRQ